VWAISQVIQFFFNFFLIQHQLGLIFISHTYICDYLTYFESFNPIEWEFVEQSTNIFHVFKQQWTKTCCFPAKFSFFLFSMTAAFDEWVRFCTFFLDVVRITLSKKLWMVRTKLEIPNLSGRNWYYWEQEKRDFSRKTANFGSLLLEYMKYICTLLNEFSFYRVETFKVSQVITDVCVGDKYEP
jgi:hypothetical protein